MSDAPTIAERLRLLEATERFASLPFDSLALVAHAARGRSLRPGDVLASGETRDGLLYVVARGHVQLCAGGSGGAEQVLAELGPGDSFGDLELVGAGESSLTARCRSDVDLLVLASADHRSLCERHPELVTRRESAREERAPELVARRAELSRVLADSLIPGDIGAPPRPTDVVAEHRVPGGGLARQWAAHREGHDVVERRYQLDDGRAFTSTYLPAAQLFRMELAPQSSRLWRGGMMADEVTVPVPAPAAEHLWSAPHSAMFRRVRLDERGRIIGLFGAGPWARLPALIEAALDGSPQATGNFASFSATGALYVDAPPRDTAPSGVTDRIICFCMQVPRRVLRQEIRAGCDRFEVLRDRTGCATACGGCEPVVRDLLGGAQWTAVTAVRIPVEPPRDDVCCLRLFPKGDARAPFVPGQHLVVEGFIEGRWVARPYTITSSPTQAGYFEICVKRVAGGALSGWLLDGELDGKALQISAPRGDLRIRPDERPVVCFVAGIGVTPALSAVRAALASTSVGAPTPCLLRGRLHLDYSARTAAELSFIDELRAASATSEGRITLRQRVTSIAGRITVHEVHEAARTLPDADFLLCGPATFMASVRTWLLAAGVPAGRIQLEEFTAATAPSTSIAFSAPTAADRGANAPASSVAGVGGAPRDRRLRILGAFVAMVATALVAWLVATQLFALRAGRS